MFWPILRSYSRIYCASTCSGQLLTESTTPGTCLLYFYGLRPTFSETYVGPRAVADRPFIIFEQETASKIITIIIVPYRWAIIPYISNTPRKSLAGLKTRKETISFDIEVFTYREIHRDTYTLAYTCLWVSWLTRLHFLESQSSFTSIASVYALAVDSVGITKLPILVVASHLRESTYKSFAPPSLFNLPRDSKCLLLRLYRFHRLLCLRLARMYSQSQLSAITVQTYTHTCIVRDRECARRCKKERGNSQAYT